MIDAMRYGVALLGLALAVMTTAACANSGKSGPTSDEGGTIYPGGNDDDGPATVSPPTGPEHPANEADEGAPPIPPDATPVAVDAGSG